MNKSDSSSSKLRWLKLLFIPILWITKLLDKHFVSFIRGRVLKDETRVYSLRLVWYRDSVYLHPMIWGSLILWFLATNAVVVESDDVAGAATGASQAAAAEGDAAEGASGARPSNSIVYRIPGNPIIPFITMPPPV